MDLIKGLKMNSPVRLTISTCLVFLAFLLPCFVRGADAPPKQITTVEIIKMLQNKIDEDVIITKVRKAHSPLDLSTDEMVELKKAGASPGLLKTLIDPDAPRYEGKSEGVETAVSAEPDNPLSPHAAGIYLYELVENKPKMTRIDPSSYKLRQGSMIGAGFGVPIKQQAVLRGQSAKSETPNRKPTFYFYFDKLASGLGDAPGQVSSPDAFTLGVFEVLKKENERRMVIGNYNVYSGGESGVESKFIRDLDFEKVSPGVFKIVPKDDLRNGEYGFYTPGNMPETAFGTFSTGGKLFDFRVNGSPDTEPTPDSKKKSSKKQQTK
jgi:hypothetical protein